MQDVVVAAGRAQASKAATPHLVLQGSTSKDFLDGYESWQSSVGLEPDSKLVVLESVVSTKDKFLADFTKKSGLD